MKTGVAAHRVVPRQPVEHDHARVALLALARHLPHHDIGAHHLLRVDDGLRHAGGAGREQQFSDTLRAYSRQRLVDGVRAFRRDEIGPRAALDPLGRAVDVDDSHAGQVERLQRLSEGCSVLHHHHAGLDEIENVAKLRVILAHQRIGRRHGRGGNPRLHGGLRHQGMFDRIAREDRDRLFRRQLHVDQRLRYGVDLALGLRIGRLLPRAFRTAALGEPHVVRPLLRPMVEIKRDAALVGVERYALAQDDLAIGPALGVDLARQKINGLERRVRRRHLRVLVHVRFLSGLAPLI